MFLQIRKKKFQNQSKRERKSQQKRAKKYKRQSIFMRMNRRNYISQISTEVNLD